MQANVNLGTMAGILIGGWLASIMDSTYVIASVGLFMILAMIVFPPLKGFKLLNKVAKDEQPDGAQAIEGVIGRGVTIRKKLTDPDLLHTVFHKRYQRIIAMLAATEMTTQQLAQQLGDRIARSRQIYVSWWTMMIVKPVEDENNTDSALRYTYDHEHRTEYNLDPKLASQNKDLILKGVNHIIQSGLTLLEKGLETGSEKPPYHMTLSTSTLRMTGNDWRHLHQRINALKGEVGKTGGEETADQTEEPLFPLEPEEERQEGTYVIVTMSYRLEDVEAVNRERNKELWGESRSTVRETGEQKELGS